MDVERPVCGVDQELAAGAVVLVAFLYRAGVPVSPVHGVLKQRQGKRVRQRSVEHSVSVVAVQVRESETTKISSHETWMPDCQYGGSSSYFPSSGHSRYCSHNYGHLLWRPHIFLSDCDLKGAHNMSIINKTQKLHILNVAKMGVRPVQLVVGVVNGDPIGPLDLSGDDRHFVGAVHPDTADKGFVAPVCPVDKSEKERSTTSL